MAKAGFWVCGCLALGLSGPAAAGVAVDLPYPKGTPAVDEIMANVYFVNHFYAVKNVSIEMDGKTVSVIIYKAAGGRPTTSTLKRYINNDYHDGVTKSKDLAIFTSGKDRGMGMLVTDFVDDAKSQTYQAWLPALRKVRMFAQPAHNDAWAGTDFNFDDVTLRKPFHEKHELLGREKFPDCQAVMQVAEEDRNWYMQSLPKEPVCDHRGKAVYKVKSVTRFADWWYDYRVSWIDVGNFGDYRTEYFKGGKKIKVIERDWGSLGMADPRGLFWKYWFGVNLQTGHETMAMVPREVFRWNTDKKASLWSEETLTGLSR